MYKRFYEKSEKKIVNFGMECLSIGRFIGIATLFLDF
jgi:hypothetical protein